MFKIIGNIYNQHLYATTSNRIHWRRLLGIHRESLCANGRQLQQLVSLPNSPLIELWQLHQIELRYRSMP